MPKFKSTEASLYNGISQQGSELRLPSQVEDAINTNLTLSRGVEIRPPVEILAEEDGEFSPDSLVAPIAFDRDISYMMVIGGDGSTIDNKVYDTDGNEYPILYQDGAAIAYLNATDASGNFSPIQALQISTVLDFNFVCNKNVTPAMSSSTEPDLIERGYLWAKNGVQQVERIVRVDGSPITHPKQTTNDTNVIAGYFFTNVPAGFTAIKTSSAVVEYKEATGDKFTLTVTDSYADTTMAAARSDGCKIEDLPPVAEADAIMTIVPEENTDAAYYLQYNEDTKSWAEVTAPGEASEIDNTTMPHAFIRKIDDGLGSVTGTPNQVYFILERIDWNKRTSGGDASAPPPSFIGKPIADTFFFKNRLGFIAGDSIVLSAADDLFRFWPTTVKEVLADDPIDVSINSTSNINLLHVSTFPESLIIVGDNEQFTLGSGGKSFTPENAVLDPTTSYAASEVVPPVTVGSTMYFIAPQSSFSAVREYSVQPDTLVTDAADVTAHVQRLIPNNLKQIIPENNLEYLFLVNTDEYSDEGNEMFVYKFYWQGNEKLQSAWMRWNFWFKPIGGLTFESQLFLIGTEKTNGNSRTVITRSNLADKPPVVLDPFDEPYKSTRPNIDRQSTIDAELIIVGDTTLLPVSESQYNYLDIDDVTPVVVDRITGIKYSILGRTTDGVNFFLILEQPDELRPSDLGYLESLVLGSYALGGNPQAATVLPEPEEFPGDFPFTLG